MKSRAWMWTLSVWLFAALAMPVQARIVYTPVNVTLPTNSYYPIDLNHDGITDFKFYLSSGHVICPPPLGHSYRVYLTVQPTTGRGGIVGSSYASALQSGVQIDFHQGFYQGIALMYSVFFGGCNFQVGQWYRVPPRYLGLQFQINGQTHYGWAELSTNGETGVNTLYGFAYETIPLKGILTGQTMDSPDEPASASPEMQSGMAATDTMVYSNGPDPGDIGYWAINHGDAVTNSFTLSEPTTIHVIKFSVYDANDRNQPLTATWAITTQPFGGRVVAGGNNAPLVFYWRIFANQFLFSQWEMGIIVDITLPPGTYWLQMQNVVTRWGTWAFWGETDGIGCSPLENCPSSAYFWNASASRNLQPVGSESFELWGVD